MGLSGGGDIVASCYFGGTWGISFASCSFGGIFWETIFLVEGYLLFFSFLLVLLVDCYVVHCPSFASFA